MRCPTLILIRSLILIRPKSPIRPQLPFPQTLNHPLLNQAEEPSWGEDPRKPMIRPVERIISRKWKTLDGTTVALERFASNAWFCTHSSHTGVH
jgi:hypothetical protein